MKGRREILIAHYKGLARKAATWVGLGSLMATNFVSAPATAAQLTARSATVSTSVGAATGVTYTVRFNPGTSGTIGSIQFEICDSPLDTVSCAASGVSGTNSNGASLVSATTTGPTGTGWTGGTWNKGATTGPGVTGTSLRYTNGGTAVSPTTAQQGTWTLSSVINPTGANQKYYLRITTYTNTNYTGLLDFGAVALATTQTLQVSATVQESLVFCVGETVGANCGTAGSGTISLGTGSGCPILSIANNCTGTSQMAASTNANSGYTITYNGSTFTGPNDTITDIGSTPAASTPASKQFGLAVTANTGSGSGAINTAGTNYNFSTNGGSYAFVSGSPQNIAAAAAATVENVYTVTYMANVSATTKPGQYTSDIVYVCTGNF